MSLRQQKSIIAKPINHDDAFITSVVPYSEADCVVRLFTRTKGRIITFFKRGLIGKKGSSSAQAPALARVGFIEASNKLSRLVSCDLDPKTFVLSSSLKIFGYGAYLAELIEKFLPEEEPDPQVFSMIEEAFLGFIYQGPAPGILRSFEVKLLAHCGYLPEMPSSLADEKAVISFDPLSCRFIPSAFTGTMPFSYEALQLVKSMLIAKIGSINYEDMRELLMIGRIFKSRLKLMGLFPLKSTVFIKQISKL